jgi:fructan beta-fructosidase
MKNIPRPLKENNGISPMKITITVSRRKIRFIVATLFLLTMLGCFSSQNDFNGTPVAYNEAMRPQYHFTPAEQWANDPNGLVYYDDEYHLFYQYNPHDTIWGPMHWGHAISPDLVNWTHLPIALYPDEIGTIFSGSAVIDWNNTAGFGEEAMVAIFTHDAGGKQVQSIAYSTDKGRIWTKYEDNPVLEPPNNIRNFRDPKVFWFETEETAGYWVMTVSAGSIVLFFTSPDLRNWTSSGGFGLTYGATCGVWETPDLFELSVDNSAESRWVLAVAIGGCAPAGGSGIQYFVGDFDGENFTSENDKDTILWADFGADFYAPQSFTNAPDSRRIWLAWMNNWSYAQDIPTTTWRGAFSLPRELALNTTTEGIRLVQQPIMELETLRGDHQEWRNETISADSRLLADVTGETLEIIAEFQIDSLEDADRFGFLVRTGPDTYTTIGYAVKNSTLFVDRMQSGKVDFNPNFPGVHTAVMKPIDGLIQLHIFLDRSSVEIFGNNGLISFTEQIFPTGADIGLEIFVDGGQVQLNNLDIYELKASEFFISEGFQAEGNDL